MFKKFVMAFVMNAAIAGVATASTVNTCVLTDATLDSNAATACQGMFDGNVSQLEDINSIMETDHTHMLNVNFADGTWSIADSVAPGFVLALKQNTKWAIFEFDFSEATPHDGFWWGTWNTDGIQWDGNSRTAGCQGCGELSHSIVAFTPSLTEVPLPGTLGLMGIGLAGLGLVRRVRA